MSCFCQTSLVPLIQSLPALDLSASGALNLSATAQTALSLDTWLTANAAINGLDDAWLSIALPNVSLSANTAMSIALMAQLQAQTQERLGINLLAPGGDVAFTRSVATLDARMSAVSGLDVQMDAWAQLATLNAALLRIQSAVSAGVFASLDMSADASSLASLSLAPDWGAFFGQIAPLSAVATAMAQFNVANGMDLSARLDAMGELSLPNLPSPNLMAMCQLSAGLSAVAQLNTSLNVNALQVGFSAVRSMVAANLSATIAALAGVGVSLNADLAASLSASLPAGQFAVPAFASAAGVQAALSLDPTAVGSLSVGATVSTSLQTGLSAGALTASLQGALGIAAASAPCPVCDCRAIMSGL